MIEDIGRVFRVADDRAFIEVERSSAYASCGLQEAEELATGGKVVFEAYNMAGANIGDRVRVQVRTGAYTKASLYVYGIPVLFLVIGAVVGTYAATILFLLRKRSNKIEYMPVIVEVMTEDVYS